MSCVFCDLIKSRKDWVYETERSCCFPDIMPASDIHLLIVPKIHIESLSCVDQENSSYITDIFEAIPKIARKFDMKSYRLVSNTGPLAGQSVNHIHFHILGGRSFAWPPG